MDSMRKTKRSYDPAAMRARILDVASAAFQSRGYHSTSTHEIMRDAGITGGALHHHFPSKKSLGLAVINERVAAAVEEAWISPLRRARTAMDGILRAFENIAESLDKQGRVLGCPLNNLAVELSTADPDFQAAVTQVYQAWKSAIVEKLKADKSQLAGRIKPDELATLVVAAYSGAIALAKAQQSSQPLRICARQLGKLLSALAEKG
ncbi:MAG TPA: TetR/AcrR family transcriptional regulator [Steroidobacter sp.]|jgi:AcrR family transcriptional regulator